MVYSGEVEKANTLNDYFRDQTLLDDENVTLLAIDNCIVDEQLSAHVFITEEVKKGKRKIQEVPQSQATALPKHQEEEEADKTKRKIEQTYEKH